MNDVTALTLTQAAQAIRDRRVSSVEVTQACLARIKRFQEKLNCFISLEEDAALAAAREADAELARGIVKGALHGVPLAHKDMFYRAGKVATCGSKIRSQWVAETTSTALERLAAAGAIQLGTLNMAEFAYGPTGHNYHYGHCRNPWGTDHITGGSSSGSGCSVAARLAFGALGSDTGGSIRAPAAFCGLAGIKPTYARVSRYGAMPLSYSLDTVGPLARTVADCAAMLKVIAGQDPNDPTSSDEPVPDFVALLEAPVRGLRVGVANQFFFDDLDPEIAAAMDNAIAVFKDLGIEIRSVDVPDINVINANAQVVMFSEASALHGELMRSRPEDYSDQVRSRLEFGYALTAVQYIDALRYRSVALQNFNGAVFAQVDLLVSPAVNSKVPTIADTDTGGSPRMAQVFARLTRLLRPVNYLGVPALVLPCGFSSDGLPIGMQLIGRPFAEAFLFRVGHQYQRATEWHRKVPVLE
jgi:aspartyl-tRNA(Asn)/glutamyl-tRNA(Gln) amidotransferase subunit A